MTNNRVSFLFLFLLFAVFSCDKPLENYQFISVKNSNIGSESVFAFEMDMEKEISYQTFISCRYNSSIIKSDTLLLLIKAISPSGKKYVEKITFPFHSGSELISRKKCSGKLLDIQWPYRKDIQVDNEPGKWEIKIKILNNNCIKGILGMGFSYQGFLPESENEWKR